MLSPRQLTRTATALGTDTFFRNSSTAICPHLALPPVLWPVLSLSYPKRSLLRNDTPANCALTMLTVLESIHQLFAVTAPAAAGLDHHHH